MWGSVSFYFVLLTSAYSYKYSNNRVVRFPKMNVRYYTYEVPVNVSKLSLRQSEILQKSPIIDFSFGPGDEARKITNRNSLVCGGKLLSKLTDEVKCIPRDTIIDLVSTNSSIEIFPKKAIVKRCNGNCRNNLSCKSTQKEMKKIEVYASINHHFHCRTLEVIQDVKCECQCRAKKCLPNQQRDMQTCKCVCSNDKERQYCDKKYFKWQKKTCSCVCKKKVRCTTGSFWNPKTCRCEV